MHALIEWRRGWGMVACHTEGNTRNRPRLTCLASRLSCACYVMQATKRIAARNSPYAPLPPSLSPVPAELMQLPLHWVKCVLPLSLSLLLTRKLAGIFCFPFIFFLFHFRFLFVKQKLRRRCCHLCDLQQRFSYAVHHQLSADKWNKPFKADSVQSIKWKAQKKNQKKTHKSHKAKAKRA